MNTSKIHIAIIFFILSVFSLSAMAQNKQNIYQQMWLEYDSLMNKGLEQDATQVITNIIYLAQKENNNAAYLKAYIYHIQMQINKSESAEDAFALLETLDQAAQNNSDKALVSAIKALSYSLYFQNERWVILERTKVATTNETLKPTAWSEMQFVDTIYKLFDKSLGYKNELLQSPIENYNALLFEKREENSTAYKNLYEFILNQYLHFNQQNIEYFSQNFKKYRTTDTTWLTLDRNKFIAKKFESNESGIDIKMKTVKAYQLLTEYYLNNNNKEKLAECDWNRLMFFNDNFKFNNDWFVEKLEQFIELYKQYPSAGSARYYLILQRLNKKTIDPKDAVKELEGLIRKFPNREETVRFYNTLCELKSYFLNIVGESVAMPEKPFNILLEYQNLTQQELAILPYLDRLENESDENYHARIIAQKPIKKYIVKLPQGDDLKRHTVEYMIEALPLGYYFIVPMYKKDSLQQEYVLSEYNLTKKLEFSVTNLAFINYGENTIKVVDRINGNPIPNAVVLLQDYNKKKAKIIADKAGMVNLKEAKNILKYGFAYIEIKHNNDKWKGELQLNYQSNENSKNEIAYYSFTDRSIYRPGQTVNFKVIAIKKTSDRNAEVIPNKKIKVSLSRNYYADKNDETLELTTNEFGSAYGSFVAPDNGYTGSYYIIIDNHQRVYIKVEEYKRPKFYNDFDSLSGNYFVNDKIIIAGTAKSYAGNNLDNAKVAFSVTRNVFFPFPWRCFGFDVLSENSEIVAFDSTHTDKHGKYNISFTALPDNTNPDFYPVFSYLVNVKISDQNGETHEFTKTVNAAYRDALIVADIPEDVTVEDLKEVKVSVTNVNSIDIPNEYNVRVVKLNAPKHLLRSRLWNTPDQFLYDAATFKKYFPNDVYKNEDKKETWAELKTTFSKTFSGKQTINFNALNAFPQNGWYVIEIKTKDAKGQEVIQKYFTHAIVDWSSKIEKHIAIVTNKNVVYPGEQLKTKVLTNNIEANQIVILKSPDKKPLKNIYDFTVSEEQRGGIYYFSYYVKDNRIYETKKFVKVPLSNKELQIKLLTERSSLLPGNTEKWSYNISGEKSESFETEILASMYDASLDALFHSNWHNANFYTDFYYNIDRNSSFGKTKELFALQWKYANDDLQNHAIPNMDYSAFQTLPIINVSSSISYSKLFRSSNPYTYYSKNLNNYFDDYSVQRFLVNDPVTGEEVNAVMSISYDAAPAQSSAPNQKNKGKHSVAADKVSESSSVVPQASFSPRTQFNETAFFYPQLRTNESGDVSFEFTIPEALTTWKWRTFAHSTDWKTGYLEGEVKTQKDLMVQPNIPRVFRQLDDVVISTKVVNLTNENLKADAWIEILNAKTLQSLILPFRLQNKNQQIYIPAGESKEVTWTVHIPESIYEPVVLRIMAKAANHTDGEEHYIPVITNRLLVTETLPLPMNGNGSKHFSFKKLLNTNSNTLLHKGLTIEYTANPSWYVVQALPYLASYPYECSEQIFSRFYANAIAQDIVKKLPEIELYFKDWQTKDTAALFSHLQKNEQLKSALLEETPWVLEAQDETAQKQRIAALFETKKYSNDLHKTLQQLEKIQLSNGAFSWFEGMYPSRFVTQTIAIGLLKMQALNVEIAKENKVIKISNTAMGYLATQMANDYKYLIKNKINLDKNNLSNYIIQYLYAVSLNKNNLPNKYKTEYAYYLSQVSKYWNNQNLMMQAYIAEILFANNQVSTAKTIIESLRQRSITNEEMGMYWKYNSGYYYWYEAPIETQAAIIQAFKKIDYRENEIARMQTWLLKNKQTNRWNSTKATVDACYALLSNNQTILKQQPNITIQLGNRIVTSENQNQQAGSGYFITNIEGKELNNQLGNIQVTVSDNNTALPSWGAVYWQYFEQYDKISSANTALKIQKEIFKSVNAQKGETLHAITEQTPINVGDKLVIRLTITTDRDLEYVHIKDTRAACFEPKDVLSQYHYKGQIGYYQTTKDISSNFFVDNMRKGTYILEYEVYANAKGKYNSGVANIQCMYAPEYSAHSSGSWLQVK